MVSHIFSHSQSHNLTLFSSFQLCSCHSRGSQQQCFYQKSSFTDVIWVVVLNSLMIFFENCTIGWQQNVLRNNREIKWKSVRLFVFLEFGDTFGDFFGVCYILEFTSQVCCQCFDVTASNQIQSWFMVSIKTSKRGKSRTQVKYNSSSPS